MLALWHKEHVKAVQNNIFCWEDELDVIILSFGCFKNEFVEVSILLVVLLVQS